MRSDRGKLQVRRRWQLLCGALLISRTVFSQSESSARQHFAHGLELVQQGQLNSAALEFETAYRISPNYAVLYNLGQAYAAQGKSVEAVRAFESYLSGGADQVQPARRQQIEELIALDKKRIGYVSLVIEPPQGEALIDGQPIGMGGPTTAVGLVVGSHLMTVTLRGYVPSVSRIEVEAQKTVPLNVSLTPLSPANAAAKVGQLSVECPVPETRIAVDDKAVTPTNGAPLLVAPGKHRVTCQREGYDPFAQSVDVVEGALTRVACGLTPEANLSSQRSGILTFSINEGGAEIQVDGHHARATMRVPSGAHSVVVRHLGFVDWTQAVVARPGFPQVVVVRLVPTAEHARDLSRAASARQTWAYALGGVGVALLGTSVALYANNNSRYRAWQQDRDTLYRDLADSHSGNNLPGRTTAVQQTAVSIERQDDAVLGLSLLGGSLLSYAIVSWVGSN